MRPKKPLGIKCYGHIPHLPNSRTGYGDHHCPERQGNIAIKKTRDEHDLITVLEKLDGANVGVAKKDDILYPLMRAGYLAISSNYKQHRFFADWVEVNRTRFDELLNNDERICGEWLAQAHSTRYNLTHEPFVTFDLFSNNKRILFNDLKSRVEQFDFITPHIIHTGDAISIGDVMSRLGKYGFHGAIDEVEGAVWRIERNKVINKRGDRRWVVDFLCKYVRLNKRDGIYLPERSGEESVWNWYPKKEE